MSNQPPPPEMPAYPQGGDWPASGYGAPPQQLQRPESISRAVTLMRAGAVISLLAIVVSLATIGSLKDTIRQRLAASGTQATNADVNAAFSVGVAAAIILGLIGVGLWLWMAWKNGQGRRWARIVATVLGALNGLSLIFDLTSASSTTLSLVFQVVSVVIGFAALYFLYRPDANQYFTASSARLR